MNRYACRPLSKVADPSAATLHHLQDEQAGFAHFLTRLRHAKAKAESTQLKQSRTKTTQARRDSGDG